MKTTTRTVYGSALQAAKYLGLKHVIVPKTTLNEKFDINATATLADGEIPATRFYCIGNGGHRPVVGADGVGYTDPIDHDASHAALYKHLPFVVRPVANDLTLEQRKNYCLREQKTISGAQYFVYWAKRFDVGSSVVTMQKTVGGITVPFVPDSTVLNPAQPAIAATGTTTTSDASLSASVPVTIEFNAFDVTELLNACNILFGNERLAIVSEIALVSGVDRMVTVKTTGGASVQFNEVIAAQVGAFISSYHDVSQNSEGFIKDLELGEVEPLLTGVSTNVVNA